MKVFRPRTLLHIAALLALGQMATAENTHGVLALTGGGAGIALVGPYASARPLIEEKTGGSVRDVSGEVTFAVADPKIARMADGAIWSVGDGKTTVTAKLKDRTVQIPVAVRGVAGAKPPRFATEVIPALTKAGCNMGGCHGAAQGKGGFKLSLQGYDPEADYEAITRAAGARRVSPAQPENSLILRKPTMAVSHKGGPVFAVGSPTYRLIADWIAGGMPAPQATDPVLAALEVFPSVRTLSVGQKQRFRVVAKFSDNSRRDVTQETLFSGSDGAVTSVTPDGEATITGKGEAAVLVRYRDLVSTASVISPFGKPISVLPTPPLTGGRRDGNSPINRLIDQKLSALGLEASPRCSDADYLRRVSLDLVGTLPTPEEVRAFLADADPKKREKLTETLLAKPEYVDYWTLKWGDILRSSRNALGDKGLVAYNHYLRQSVAQNKPWNRLAREIVLAQGSMYEEGAANYFRAASTPETLAETTAQVFMGVRMQCARCHNHPYERWKQTQYYQLAAFYARVRFKPGTADDERIVYTVNSGEVTHPKTKQAVTPTALDAAPLPATYDGDRRKAFADWLTGPQNPFFAKILVNRVWKHFMGQGMVEPVDDMRVTNPPTNAALLDYLAQDFVKNGYDIQQLMRSIIHTDAYQRTAIPTPRNAADTHYYSHFFFKRLGAEPLFDAVGAATGVQEKFGGYPAGLRAAELPDTTAESYFLDLFGRPARNIVCQCERLDAPNLGQTLHFMNGKSINARLASKDGRVSKLLAAKTLDVKVVENLYLASLSRYPSEDETMESLMLLARGKDKQKEAEDLLWALLNSKEFVFNH